MTDDQEPVSSYVILIKEKKKYSLKLSISIFLSVPIYLPSIPLLILFCYFLLVKYSTKETYRLLASS